ncbi:MAG: UDP-N-acetylmuramoyl-L-alanyl-D-glutamate--2,6-diaminopimelate ligase [bacterium]
MDKILNFIKRIIPKGVLKKVLPFYHISLASAAAFWYGYPSEKMIVIGVTGTNGKSTTTELIARVLEKHTPNPSQEGKYKVGFTSTVKFKVGDREWLNDKKMTMVGRFQLQKLLHQMADAGCRYAVIETSSEGVKQFRHKAINYDYLVFTNLTPEHIESHGSFEKYKEAKLKLFDHLSKSRRKVSRIHADSNADTRGNADDVDREIKKIIIVNGDDKYASEFLNFKVDKKIVYGMDYGNDNYIGEFLCFRAENIVLTKNGTSFNVVPPSFESLSRACRGKGARGRFSEVGIEKFTEFGKSDTKFKLNLPGLFNVYNAMPAIIIGENEGLEMQEIKDALARVKNIPGRMEFIDEGQPFTILVDYAPEPESMRKLYEAVGAMGVAHNKIIHVLGSCGGGRDKARRPILGSIAAENADYVIITNEDPYDDDPMEIIEDVAGGAEESLKFKVQKLALSLPKGQKSEEVQNIFKILDRREAIRKALQLANEGDFVIITGKGAEQFICVADGKKIPWDDRDVVREEIGKLKNSPNSCLLK